MMESRVSLLTKLFCLINCNPFTWNDPEVDRIDCRTSIRWSSTASLSWQTHRSYSSWYVSLSPQLSPVPITMHRHDQPHPEWVSSCISRYHRLSRACTCKVKPLSLLATIRWLTLSQFTLTLTDLAASRISGDFLQVVFIAFRETVALGVHKGFFMLAIHSFFCSSGLGLLMLALSESFSGLSNLCLVYYLSFGSESVFCHRRSDLNAVEV